MKTVKGIYAEAKIFTDDVEEYAEAQVKMICDNEVADGSTICMMPDIHPGKIAPIGLSMTVTDKVIPQLLGVDIGCGMTCVKLNKNNAEFQKLDRIIRENVPSGFTIRKEPHHMAEEFSYEELHCVRHINRQKADRSLGTLGGGNHFIELDKSDDGSLYLVVHTGSRHLGEEVAEYYTKLANNCLKEQGSEIPYYMSYLEGDNREAYLEDVQVIQRYAELNRQIIVREILKGMKWKAVEQFSVAHNFIDDSGILHKGSISARGGEKVVIPANMKEGVILGIGKGNAQWNCSAPHGSGRRLKREDVKNQYTVSEFKKEMKGIYSSCVGADTLDEAPFAYRSIAEIASDKEYRIEKFHCGGKGGQNVNKVETGVWIIHIPTGLVSQSTEERSQFQNKRKDMEKLQEKLADLQKEQEAKQVNAAWREHTRIVRGNPVRVYEGEKFVLKK